MHEVDRYHYRRVGTMHYEVTRGDLLVGELWRTRDGWAIRPATNGKRQFTYGISRSTAAGALYEAEQWASEQAAFDAGRA